MMLNNDNDDLMRETSMMNACCCSGWLGNSQIKKNARSPTSLYSDHEVNTGYNLPTTV